MKRINRKVQDKLYLLFIPLAVVVILYMVSIGLNYNVLEHWFGLEIDATEWIKPAMIGSFLIFMLGESIVAIKEKCWAFLAVIWGIFLFMILNMSNIFVSMC